MTDREAMQQALEALELLAKYENPLTKIQVRKPRDGGQIVTVYPHKVATEAAAPLRERLAQPEQERVIDCPRCGHCCPQQPEQEPFCYHDGRNIVGKEFADHSDVFPLYTALPPRQWQGLTEEDLFDIANVNFGEPDLQLFIEMGKLVQEELKEKNAQPSKPLTFEQRMRICNECGDSVTLAILLTENAHGIKGEA